MFAAAVNRLSIELIDSESIILYVISFLTQFVAREPLFEV